MQAIDLSPPGDWLEDFPLSRQPFRDLNNSVEWVLRLPKSLEELKKELSFSDATVNMVREQMECLVQVYVNVRTNAIKYRTDILPSIIVLAKNLNSHASIVDTFYTTLYKSVQSLAEGEQRRSLRLIRIITKNVGTQMARLFDTSGDIVTEVKALHDNINEDGSHVVENLQRLVAVRDTMHTSRFGGAHKVNTNPLIFILQKIRGLSGEVPSNTGWQEEGSPLDTLQLQNELLESGLRHILECLREAVNILEYMQHQFGEMRDNFSSIQDRATNQTDQPPTDIFPHEPSPPIVIQQWEGLSNIIGTYLETVHQVDNRDDSSW